MDLHSTKKSIKQNNSKLFSIKKLKTQMFQPTSLIVNFDGMFSSQHLQTPKFASL
jgi:hypothetical protein